MKSFKYIVELAERSDYPPERALRSGLYDESIRQIKTGAHPTNTYWTDWGGTYDTPLTNDIELFFNTFLQQVPTSTAMLETENSYYKRGDYIDFNIPKYPWQYSDAQTETLNQKFYSSSVPDEKKQSDDRYVDDQLNKIRYPVRLEIPSLPTNLSSSITGSVLYSTFTANLINNDGLFDDIESIKYVNTPVRIKRADTEVSVLSDFTTIREGLVESVSVDFSRFTITGADYYRTFEQSATDKFTISEFPDLPDNLVDKDKPIGWGLLRGVPLNEVSTGSYLALDSNYITSVQAVYDQDGNSISFGFDGYLITATDAKTADVTGRTQNSIGQIIKDITQEKGNIAYIEGIWDTFEMDQYISSSAGIGMYYSSGTVRDLIDESLKSDSAFFMTKTNGLLTVRRYGDGYAGYLISSWVIMGNPKKDNKEAVKFYNSTSAVKYVYNESQGTHLFEKKDDSREAELLSIYKKSRTQTYNTRLLTDADARNLNTLMLDRFGDQSESLTIAIGESIKDINLLDKITLPVVVNDREFSVFSNWILVGMNPAQDVLQLRSDGKPTTNVYLATSDEKLLVTSSEQWMVASQE